jgi:hypothetical protein
MEASTFSPAKLGKPTILSTPTPIILYNKAEVIAMSICNGFHDQFMTAITCSPYVT